MVVATRQTDPSAKAVVVKGSKFLNFRNTRFSQSSSMMSMLSPPSSLKTKIYLRLIGGNARRKQSLPSNTAKN